MLAIRPYGKKENGLSYDPFGFMDEFERRFFGSSLMGGAADFKTDIRDNGDSFLLEADLPGFDKQNISIDLNGDMLSISAERHSEHEEKDNQGKYIRCERSYGSYNRQFDISGVDSANIRAKYENGVLSLTLPKKDKVIPETKKLEIE